ncbi:hypothetical protein HAX54_013979 [Datura stramonium]|uniref:Uncharacterized protein n=1 Tax=Datura stramonium TaxID=4076 RepID=A0ABS8Y1Y9_DATST|nr:hypothetical protein [Datura stramonium]
MVSHNRRSFNRRGRWITHSDHFLQNPEAYIKTYGCILRAIERKYGPLTMPVGSLIIVSHNGTLSGLVESSPYWKIFRITFNDHNNGSSVLTTTRTNDRLIRQNKSCYGSSGSEKNYDIDSSDDSLVMTTRVKSKEKESVVATSPLPQSEERGEGTNFESEDPPADDAEREIIMLRNLGMMVVQLRSQVERRVPQRSLVNKRRSLNLPPHQMQGPKYGSYRALGMFIM